MVFEFYCRAYQTGFRGVSALLNWHEPFVIEGPGALRKVGEEVLSLGLQKVLIVTDKGLMNLGLLSPMLASLDSSGIAYAIYDGTVPNPTLSNVREALSLYKQSGCEGIIAFGGGSPMDCAKGVGAALARPNKKLVDMSGVLKVGKDMPPFFAVPTTSGTGSECTITSVLTDEVNQQKFTVNDLHLIPHVAVLDPELTKNLPPQITAETGMDTLTHAVEAYIGGSNTKMTKKYARSAVKKVFKVLPYVYKNGDNLKARALMQKAAYHGGMAFTRAYVGYVHAMAHQLGGYYHVPHGRANAVLLPYVLEYFSGSIYKQLAELADLVGLGDDGASDDVKANRFIEAIKKMNRDMGIADTIPELKAKDIPELAKRAAKEGNPLYPVPVIWRQGDFEAVYRQLLVK